MPRKKRMVHGLSKTPEYRTWQGILQRCNNPASQAYSYYGGRGITVCERWQEFTNFYADMGARPSSGHTIDRIDSNGHYHPDNCRWATRLEQQRNTRRSRHIKLNGESMAIGEAVERSGVNRSTIIGRIRRGLSPDQAMSLPSFHPDATRVVKTSQYIGVSWDSQRNRWFAFAKVNGKMKNLGRFDDEREAAICRDCFVHRTHGSSALLNFSVDIIQRRYPEKFSPERSLNREPHE